MDPIAENHEVVMLAPAIQRGAAGVPDPYSIRVFEPRDVPAWTAIQAAADRYNVITDELFQSAFGSDSTLHRDRILMACSAAGEPLGTAAAWFGEGERESIGRLHWVAVTPEHQGRGLGRALVQHAMARLASLGHAAAYLTTSAARLTAIHLYHTCGFVPVIENERDRAAWHAISRALAAADRPLDARPIPRSSIRR